MKGFAFYSRLVVALFAAQMLPATMTAQKAVVYTTSEDGTHMLSKEVMDTQAGMPLTNYIEIDTTDVFQPIDGFGYALTGSSCYNLMKMDASEREALLTQLFSETKGFGASYVRISIGCSDFSTEKHTLCDTKGISNFALQDEENNYVIPVIKQVMAINPKLKIFAAPWTCPKWMKVIAKGSSIPYLSFQGGHLNKEYYADYATYFVKFIQAMKDNGIDIYAVSPQNEPQNAYNEGGALLMDYDEQADFIKVLAPAFHAAGLNTKIYVLDHNFDIESYAENVMNLLADTTFDGKELVAGGAFHNYGGDVSAMGTFHDNIGAEAVYTETALGEWNDGHAMSDKFVSDFLWSGISALQYWSRGFITWNLMLDSDGNPTLLSNNTVYGTLEISPSTYSYASITYNRDYYTVSHLAAVIRPGAVRCGVNQMNETTTSSFNYAAVKNPDGTTGFVLGNNTASLRKVSLCNGSEYVTVNVPAKSVVSVLLGNVADSGAVKFGGMNMTLAGDSSKFSLTTRLVKNRKYEATGSSKFTSENFYCDPDFFENNGDGTFTFMAATGTYNVLFDSIGSYFRVYATDATGRPDTLNTSSGTGALWCIGSDGTHKPLYSDISGEGWRTDVDHAMCLAAVSSRKYQMTLTVGKQLNPNDVNFKFFGQAGWGVELNPTGSYKITSTSDIFLVGEKLVNGHDDGNIYLASGKTLTDGDTYRFTVDMTKPAQPVLSVENLTIAAGIQGVKKDSGSNGDDAYYTVDGVRLPEKPALRGVYIHAGKAVLLK